MCLRVVGILGSSVLLVDPRHDALRELPVFVRDLLAFIVAGADLFEALAIRLADRLGKEQYGKEDRKQQIPHKKK
jgi:hypothetical protein